MPSNNARETFQYFIPVSTHICCVSHAVEDLGGGLNLDFMIQTPDDPIQIFFGIVAGGDVNLSLREGVEFSSAGTILPSIDLNRVTPLVSPTVFSHTPTITDLGVELGQGTVLGGSDLLANKNMGATASSDLPIIMAADNVYLLRLTNLTAGDQLYRVTATFLETPRIHT